MAAMMVMMMAINDGDNDGNNDGDDDVFFVVFVVGIVVGFDVGVDGDDDGVDDGDDDADKNNLIHLLVSKSMQQQIFISLRPSTQKCTCLGKCKIPRQNMNKLNQTLKENQFLKLVNFADRDTLYTKSTRARQAGRFYCFTKVCANKKVPAITHCYS